MYGSYLNTYLHVGRSMVRGSFLASRLHITLPDFVRQYQVQKKTRIPVDVFYTVETRCRDAANVIAYTATYHTKYTADTPDTRGHAELVARLSWAHRLPLLKTSTD